MKIIFSEYYYLHKKIDLTDTDVMENVRLVKAADTFVFLLQKSAIKEDIATLIMGFTEDEASKLFANST